MSYNFPKIELSAAEQQWLGTICQQFLNGYLVDVDRLKKSWHAKGKWPQGFRPSDIDERLLWYGNKPTLLGIWHAYPVPQNIWIEKFDELVKYVKARISNSTSKGIKVTDIAEAIGLPERSVSILIHLLPSMGFYYTATVAPVRRDVVRIPGELDMYASLQLDDPEKMDDYLSYEGIEEHIKKIYAAPDSSTKGPSANEEKFIHANQLYDKAKSLINSEALDQDTAKLIIESADDAIKEFGNTNQEKKVELRRIKSEAEDALPPATVEELRKRAEGKALKKIHPSSRARRTALYVAVGLSLGGVATFASWKQLFTFHEAAKPESSPAPFQGTIEQTNGSNQRQTSTVLDEAAIASNSPSFSPISMRDFYETMFDKPLTSVQQEEFLKNLVGRRVIWEGYVIDASDDTSGETLRLVLLPDDTHDTSFTFFTFSAEYRADVLALKPHQKVKVTGILRRFDGHARLDDSKLLQVWPAENLSPH